MSEGMTPSDLAAVMGNENGFGNGGAWWVIILFVLLYGGGFNRTGELGQYATAASQQEILFGQQFQSLDNKIDQIGNGICDATYALTNNINSVAGAVAEVKYEGAINTAAINANIDAKFAAMEKSALERDIAERDARIARLELQNEMCGVIRYPNTFAYNAGANPFCGCGNGAY